VQFGSRFGPQNMVVCGWALQALKAYPGLWDEQRTKNHPDDLLVGFAAPSETVTLGGASFRLLSRRDALVVTARGAGSFRICSQPDAQGSWAEVTMVEGTAKALSSAGEALRVESKLDGAAFEITIPYTVVKDQKAWANGIELYRYSIAAGGATRNFTIASSEEQVKQALLRELGEGLRTWRKIFDEKGYIPTGEGAGWSQISDTGGYAHLLSAGAQWLNYLDGKRDWELSAYPRAD